MRPLKRTPRLLARRSVKAAALVVFGALLALVTYNVSVEPGALLVRAVFETGREVTPPADYGSIAATVQQHPTVPLRTRGAPEAHLLITTPRSAGGTPHPIVLWIHGGGFISSSAETVQDYAVLLAQQGFVVANLDYSIAPGARHPAPVRQGSSALAYLRRHGTQYGGDASKIVLGGDSAGAQIASELAAAETSPRLARAIGIPTPPSSTALRGVVLFCGLYDMETVGRTGFPALRTYLWAYTGHRNWLDAPGITDMSTTSTATADYPPTFVSVGNTDPFRSQESELAATLRAEDVPVTELTWNGSKAHLGHEYQFDFATPQADVAFDRTVSFLRAAARR